jgi:hypothetical protein
MRFLSILIFILSVRSLAQVRIMMIDAGTPDRSVYPTKGLNFNVGPPHYHGTAMYQFLTMGPSASSSKYNCSFTVDTCSFTDNVGSNVNSSYYYCLKKAAEGSPSLPAATTILDFLILMIKNISMKSKLPPFSDILIIS